MSVLLGIFVSSLNVAITLEIYIAIGYVWDTFAQILDLYAHLA